MTGGAGTGGADASARVELSVVVPVHDEEESLRPLLAELEPVVTSITADHEFVFVDDGSRDGSARVLEELRRANPRVAVWSLDGNHGLSAALHCGFTRARGRVIATLDADLQNDPSDLPRLLVALAAGADMACGWRRERADPLVKRISSRIANTFRNARTGDGIHDVTCPMKVFRREVLEIFHPYSGLHRFLPTLAIAAGYRVVEVPVRHRPRRFGRSHHGVRNRLFRGLSDLAAVRWMQRRRMTYRASKAGGDGPA